MNTEKATSQNFCMSFTLGVSSTNNASRLRASGSKKARMVFPLTLRVAYDAGFFPFLENEKKNNIV